MDRNKREKNCQLSRSEFEINSWMHQQSQWHASINTNMQLHFCWYEWQHAAPRDDFFDLSTSSYIALTFCMSPVACSWRNENKTSFLPAYIRLCAIWIVSFYPWAIESYYLHVTNAQWTFQRTIQKKNMPNPPFMGDMILKK